ncbi:MAG: stage V sporulation protein SpoVM [Clostridia bacterium]|nr:stage V sporulation protein SpoVM [Clostridia bacterium]
MGGGTMQVVVWKSPKALGSILRLVFGIKKSND